MSLLAKKGFTLLPPLLSPSLLSRHLLPSFPTFFHTFPTKNYPDEWHYRPNFTYPFVTREICNGWKTNPLIAAVVLSENLGSAVCSTMGWSGCRIAQDDVIWKTPDVYDNTVHRDDNDESSSPPTEGVDAKSTVGFHQDSSYISHNFVPYTSSSCTLWIALDDSGPANGGLTYAVGSHNWNTYDIDPLTQARVNLESSGMTFMSSAAFTEPLHSALHLHNLHNLHYTSNPPSKDSNIAYSDVVLETPQVPSGSGLLHLQDTWHGSSGNKSKSLERRAIAIHYINDSCKFRPATSPNKSGPWGDATYIYGRYRRFGSNELDGSFFPCTFGKDKEPWIDGYIAESGVEWREIGREWAESIR
jgi:ectoine hydroxylase-related dioxygenase (phytanoyl-CoA dioxygenase family)